MSGAELLLIGSLVATGVSTYTGIQASRQQARSQEILNKFNANVAEKEAAAVRRASLDEQARFRKLQRAAAGERKVAAAVSGAFGGSIYEVELDSLIAEEENLLAFVQDFENQAVRSLEEAGIHQFKAKTSRRQGRYNVAMASARGTSSAFSSTYSFGEQRGWFDKEQV